MPDVKRLLDAVAAAFLLVVLGPLFAVVALLIRVSSPGPVLFRQTRIGLEGRPFSILKFRSMVVNASALGSWSTRRNDPRITSFGRLLRRTSLDELPQLLNVLRGDMSLVGPRPDVPEQKSLYTEEEWRTRHGVRPGITGWAQVSFRHEGTPERRKAYDLDYVRNRNLVFDVRILLLTVRHILSKKSY